MVITHLTWSELKSYTKVLYSPYQSLVPHRVSIPGAASLISLLSQVTHTRVINATHMNIPEQNTKNEQCDGVRVRARTHKRKREL